MIYKKVFYILSLIVTTEMYAMKKWNEKAEATLRAGIEFSIKQGSSLFNSHTNGVLKVCQDLHERLASSAPHMLQVSPLAHQLLTTIAQQPKYKDAFATAKLVSSTVQDKTQREKAWMQFRIAAAHLLADEVESKTKLKYNRKKENWAELFHNNHALDPKSKDGEYMQASLLALYGLTNVTEEAQTAS